MRGDQGGSAAVTVIVLLPLLLVVCAGVVQLGALRVVAARVAIAADLATLAAVSDQDRAGLVSAGRLRLAPDAGDVARDYFVRNLAALEGHLGARPAEIARLADVAVFPDAPAVDPLTATRYDRPSVRLLASVPVLAPALGVLLIPPSVVIRVRSVSAAR